MAYIFIGLPAAIGIGLLLFRTAKQNNLASVPIERDDDSFNKPN